jgi:hypothetical protein
MARSIGRTVNSSRSSSKSPNHASTCHTRVRAASGGDTRRRARSAISIQHWTGPLRVDHRQSSLAADAIGVDFGEEAKERLRASSTKGYTRRAIAGSAKLILRLIRLNQGHWKRRRTWGPNNDAQTSFQAPAGNDCGTGKIQSFSIIGPRDAHEPFLPHCKRYFCLCRSGARFADRFLRFKRTIVEEPARHLIVEPGEATNIGGRQRIRQRHAAVADWDSDSDHSLARIVHAPLGPRSQPRGPGSCLGLFLTKGNGRQHPAPFMRSRRMVPEILLGRDRARVVSACNTARSPESEAAANRTAAITSNVATVARIPVVKTALKPARERAANEVKGFC